MTEQTTALAPQAAVTKEWALTRETLAETALCKRIADERGIDALSLLAAVQRGIKCEATTADVLIFVAQAQKYDLDFIGNPPEIQLLNFGNGPQPYARVDAYKKYIRKARESGELRWAHYSDEWRDDPRCALGRVNEKGEKIADAPKQRCGVVRFQLRHDPAPGERIAWLYEWIMPKNPNWTSRTSQMLLHRTWKEFCRDYLGYTIADEDDGERIRDARRDEPRHVEATVADSRIEPAVPIKSLKRAAPAFAPAPSLEDESPEGGSRAPAGAAANTVQLRAPLAQDDTPQGTPPTATQPTEPTETASTVAAGSSGQAPASPAASLFGDLPDPKSEEGRKLAAELDAEFGS